MIMSYWTWNEAKPQTTPQQNALEPRKDFDLGFKEEEKEDPKASPKPSKQVDRDTPQKPSAEGEKVGGYVCLIHDVEY